MAVKRLNFTARASVGTPSSSSATGNNESVSITSSSVMATSNSVMMLSTSETNLSRISPSSLLHGCGKLLINSSAFRALVSKAFDLMDDSGDGVIDEAELYSGLLLVHLNLAKYAGPAACYPPTRSVCDRLFMEADRDNSGGLDRNQFHWIMGVLCAQILSRMFVYYVVLILCVPVLASNVVSFAQIPKDTYLELATQQGLSCGIFFVAIPLLWNAIDARYSGSSADGSPGNNTDKSDGVNMSESQAFLLPSKREEQRQRRRRKKSQIMQSDDVEINL